jgi:energy coupling factor transporter S component ThiW
VRHDATVDRAGALRRLVLAGMFAALGTLLGPLSIPFWPTRIAPLQHTINAIAGIWVGPWYAAAAALTTAFLRHSLGWGTIFAYPGSPFGALAVGFAYRFLRTDAAALFEPIGTGPVGATLAALFFQPLVGSHHALWWFQVLFLSSSIPGAILGYALVRLLRRVPALGGGAHPRPT